MAAQHHGDSPNARFLAGAVPGVQTPAGRIRNAFSVSMLAHAAGFLCALLVMSRLPDPQQPAVSRTELPEGIVWIAERGLGGGGGGGGERRPEPPRPVELPGREKITVPAKAAPTPEPPKEAPQVELSIPAIATSAGLQEIPGVLTSITVPVTDSRGSGDGPGAGNGRGAGLGRGDGDGLGEGFDFGTGGGVPEPGSGVTMPRIIHEEKPHYTNEAMRARVQGAVFMEAVVMPDGTVGPVQITRSLDRVFGLDEEAIRTVKQWRFLPGRRGTTPVPVRVQIEMSFTLR
jgi:periplasmic protein TonB